MEERIIAWQQVPKSIAAMKRKGRAVINGWLLVTVLYYEGSKIESVQGQAERSQRISNNAVLSLRLGWPHALLHLQGRLSQRSPLCDVGWDLAKREITIKALLDKKLKGKEEKEEEATF